MLLSAPPPRLAGALPCGEQLKVSRVQGPLQRPPGRPPQRAELSPHPPFAACRKKRAALSSACLTTIKTMIPRGRFSPRANRIPLRWLHQPSLHPWKGGGLAVVPNIYLIYWARLTDLPPSPVFLFHFLEVFMISEKYIVLRWMIDHPEEKVNLKDSVYSWDCTVLYYSNFFRSFMREKEGKFVVDVPLNRCASLYGMGLLSDNDRSFSPYSHEDMDAIGVNRGYTEYGLL